MEDLTVEVVGKILSRVAAARDVVSASTTCRKWRQAFQEHLRVLSFNWREWKGFKDLPHSRVEILISRTLFQTSRLESLLIELGDAFSPSVVVSWLLHTRRSLKELHCDVRSKPPMNVVDISGMEKLEKLTLAYGLVTDVDPNYYRFTSLRSLSLIRCFCTRGQALTALIAGCPKLESLELVDSYIGSKIEVRAPNLRRFYCEDIIPHAIVREVILESDGIEHIRLRGCYLSSFKVTGKGSLKNMAMDNVFFLNKGGAIASPPFDLCDSANNLETIDISRHMNIPLSAFYRLISKSSKLQTLSLWKVTFDEWTEAIDLLGIAACCPHLCLLSLDCSLQGDQWFPYCLRGSARFENVTCLKVGWLFTPKDEIVDLVEGLLDRCPNLKKLVIDGIVPGLKNQKEGQVIVRFINSIFRIMGKCINLKVQFVCDK